MRLRGALLGAGNIALQSHVPQWTRDARLQSEVEIVAVADLSPGNLDRALVLLPDARAYASAEELLRRERLDFCDVCTPPFAHRALVEQAAALGIHVVCEKPLAQTLEDAEAIEDAVRATGIVFQPCHQYHYAPQWQAIRAMLPRLGRLYFVEYEIQRTSANPGNEAWNPGWRTDSSLAGGGILVDHGAHLLYQLDSVLGEPRGVQAAARTLKHHGYGVEDTVLLTLDYPGALAQVQLSWAAHARRVAFRFVGDRGELRGDDKELTVRADTTETVRFAAGVSDNSSHAEWYAPLLNGFVDRVRAGDRDTAALEEAVRVTRVIARAYASSSASLAPVPLGADPARADTDAGDLSELALAASDPAAGAGTAGRARGRWLRWGGAAAVAAMVSWTFADVRWSLLRHALSHARPGWILAAAVVNFAVLVSQAARWLALVRPFSGRATLGSTLKAMLVGFAVSTVVPARAGELARVAWFSRTTLLSRVAVVGSIVMDHLVNAVGLLLGVALLPFLIEVPLWLRPGAYFALALFTAGAMLVASLTLAPAAATRVRLPERVSRALALVRQGLSSARDPRSLGLSLGASMAAWALEINVTTLSLRAVGLHLPLAASIFVLVAVNLALAIPFAPPGNLGTLELGATLALVTFGVPKEQALAFALCYHLLQVVPVAICGFAVLSRSAAPPAAWAPAPAGR